MQEAEHSDFSDDADYAASVQQASASVMMTRTDSGSSGQGDSGGATAEVVYLKDNVTIHPSQFASERISGRLKLIKDGSSLFMTWIPYKGQSANDRLSERDRNLYTIRAVPFTDVRSIRRHTPTLGWQYIIVVLSSGLAYPPLYFYNGGVKEFIATVKQHVFIVRAPDDANVFLVNDFQNPLQFQQTSPLELSVRLTLIVDVYDHKYTCAALESHIESIVLRFYQRTLSSLELPVSIASGPSMSISVGESSQQRIDGSFHQNSSPSQSFMRQKQKNHDPARDLSIHVLEKFSLVTKFARDTTSQLFREGQTNGFGSFERKNENKYYPDSPEKESKDGETVPDRNPVPNDPIKLDKLTLVWGKPRQPPLGNEEWATFLDSEGRVIDSSALRKRIFYGGVEQQLRREVWAFLLGYHSYDSTYAEREFFRSTKKMEYETVKQQWQSISPEQAKRFTKFRERKGLIEKDVVRTDRSISFYDGDDNPNVNILRDILLTYSFYNFDLGYCQGMSDFLSPILFVMRDESESFWCFVALMERLGPNFNRDQSGMHAQLFALSKLVELLDIPLNNYFKQNDCLNYFFCFRWVLIQFKREFEYEKTMRMWEVLWTHHLSEHFHLYVCVAILKRYRNKIIGEQMDFDTLLKFINELSGHIELDAVLRDAEALCICAGENGAACIPPGTPPSLPIDNENGYLYTQQDEVL